MSIQITVMSLDFDSSAAPFTQVFEKDEITLGRLPGNDLVLDKPEVSGYHASLRIKEGDEKPQLVIKDLGSSNGTMLENNSLRAQIEVAVEPNQRIIIGNYLIKPTVVASKPKPASIEPVAEVQKEEPIKREAPISIFQSREQMAPTTIIPAAQFDENRSVANGSGFSFHSPSASKPSVSVNNEPEEVVVTPSPVVTQVPAKLASLSTSASAESFVITVALGDEDVEDLDFIAQQLFDLRGVISHKGQPLVGVSVVDTVLGTTNTNELGEFSFENVLEGNSFDLEFSKDGYIFEGLKGSIDLLSSSLQIAARKLRTIRGRIMHGSTPLAGAVVDGGAQLGKALTDANGYYQFSGVPEGAEYTLTVSKEKFAISSK
jgi:pSer/pThr/pTyr-binding forkhead associated (FHA) protein